MMYKTPEVEVIEFTTPDVMDASVTEQEDFVVGGVAEE